MVRAKAGVGIKALKLAKKVLYYKLLLLFARHI